MKLRFAMLVALAVAVLAPSAFAENRFSGAFSSPHVRPSVPDFVMAEPEMTPDPQTSSPATYFYVVTALDVNGLVSNLSNEASSTLKQGMTTGVTLRWTNGVPSGSQAALASNSVYRSTTTGACTANTIGSTTCPKIGNVAVGSGSPTFVDPFVAPPASNGLTATVS